MEGPSDNVTSQEKQAMESRFRDGHAAAPAVDSARRPKRNMFSHSQAQDRSGAAEALGGVHAEKIGTADERSEAELSAAAKARRMAKAT